MQISERMPKEVRINFLKSDCVVSLLASPLGQKDPNHWESCHKYTQHYRASLDAIHRLKPDDPFYFFGKSLLYLRLEKEPIKAMDIAQEGLTVIRRGKNISAADMYYDWLLTRIKAICLSTSNRNEDAIKVVNECLKHMELLPDNERGLTTQMSTVIDWMQSGKQLSSMSLRGKTSN